METKIMFASMSAPEVDHNICQQSIYVCVFTKLYSETLVINILKNMGHLIVQCGISINNDEIYHDEKFQLDQLPKILTFSSLNRKTGSFLTCRTVPKIRDVELYIFTNCFNHFSNFNCCSSFSFNKINSTLAVHLTCQSQCLRRNRPN